MSGQVQDSKTYKQRNHILCYVSGYVDMAMKTMLSLREYEDILDPADIYSLLGKCKQVLYCMVLSMRKQDYCM